jgi:predicted Zn-ribbon and HTH transcriptional regulator
MSKSTYDPEIKLWKHQCRNCNEFWVSELEAPLQCPRCKVKSPLDEKIASKNIVIKDIPK